MLSIMELRRSSRIQSFSSRVMADQQEQPLDHPLVAALPPATDDMTYLALVDVNLKKHDLPLFNRILRDNRDLCSNIGWDLVLRLTPLLPESRECLQTIAKLGNPREVILKTSEAIRMIEHQSSLADVKESVQTENPIREVQDIARENNESSKQDLPLPVLQFTVLLDMLATLHTRIKTSYPSRFMSTTLQACFASFSEAQTHIGDMTLAALDLVRALHGKARPKLPPRQPSAVSEGIVLSAGDPEALSQVESSVSTSPEELAMQTRLLQAFLTHIFEVYLDAVLSDEDTPGLALSGRIFEKTFPDRNVPGRTALQTKFSSNGQYEERDLISEACLVLIRDLGLDAAGLIEAATATNNVPATMVAGEDDPPDKAIDIPLSRPGALYLLAASLCSPVLLGSNIEIAVPPIFPMQANLIQIFIGTEDVGGPGSAGSEPEPVIDSIIALGLLAVAADGIGLPESDDQFMEHLQRLSLLSANTPSPLLRSHAHLLTSSVLRSHPNAFVRLTFIRDTLEHCPYENLKASAVSWIKGETLETNPTSPVKDTEDNLSVFATPVALESLAPFLFPDLTQSFGSKDVLDGWIFFRTNLNFYLATLNFNYLLLTAKHLHEPLGIASLQTNHNMTALMCVPLREAGERFRASLNGGKLAEEEGSTGINAAMLDLDLLDDVLGRVEQAAATL